MLKVLLVEDENLIRRGLQFQMDWTEVGCVVAGDAATGKEGLAQIKALKPDIVITDIRMPDMDGLEMLSAGRGECEFEAIIITGYSEFDYAKQAIHLGVSEYLLKPVDPDETEAAIRRAIRQIEAGRRLAELAAEAPEPETAPEQETEPAGEGESDRNALVMDHVRKYMEDNYMADLSLDSVSEILHISPA